MFKKVRTLFLVGLLVLAILVLLPVPTSGVTSTLIIRPNGPGTHTDWTAYPTTPNWQCVDEVDPNYDTDYVYLGPPPPKQDNYNLEDHTTETGNISNVRVVICARLETVGDDQISIQLVIAGTKYNGVTVTLNETYAQYISDWPQNPATNSNWTWSDIDALQAGFKCLKVGPKSPVQRVTQLYVEVTHTLFFLPPVASFTYSPEIPIVNETVTFNASESYDPDGGPIANYTWSFGDTNVTTVTDPIISHIYTAIGSYPVTLNVTDDEGETGSTTQIVGVAKRPVADFTFSPESPLVGETVTFDASLSTPNGGSIVNYTWNFDDGNVTTVTDPIITHIYDAPQNYTVTLNITDSEGLTDTTSKWILVRKGPIASFTISPDPPYYKDDTLTFNASDSTPDGGNLTDPDSYFWDFDDGTNTTGMVVDHVYTNAGNYTVTLNVTDSEGLWDTTSENITISLRPPVANFTISPDPPYYVPIELTFNGSEPISYDPDGYIVSWNWTIQDETMAVIATLSGSNVSYTFTAAGTYTINLTVTDNDDLTNSTSKSISTGKAPVANFTYSPAEPLVGEPVTFNASLSTPNGGSIVNYTWNFDDGNVTTVTGPLITHVYMDAGTYTVTLNVTDSEGLWNTTSKDITVIDYPVANFTVSPPPPYYVPATLTFNASLSTPNGGSIVNYTWNFDDGNVTTVTGPLITHVYMDAGTYTVTLNVTDSEGLWNTTSKDITVHGCDVAVISVVPAENQAYPTWVVPLNISVTVLNNGTEPINCTVAAYYVNATAAYEIGTLPVNNLAAGAQLNLTFSWNLSDVAYGNYTIKANATVLDVTDANLANNELVDGTVKVKMPGDVDGNGEVKGFDAALFAAAWWTVYGDPDYNHQCDFDNNGEVKGFDAALFAGYWWQTY